MRLKIKNMIKKVFYLKNVININTLNLNKKLKYLIILFGLSLIYSCNNSVNDNYIDLIPVKLTKDGKISLIKSNGEVEFKDEFDSQSEIISYEGIIYEKSKSAIHYYKINNKKIEEIVVPKNIEEGTIFSEGVALVRDENGNLFFINKMGKEVLVLSQIKDIKIIRSGILSDGLIKVKVTSGKWGFIDITGKVVISAKYTEVENFKNGLARVKNEDGSLNIINKEGKELLNDFKSEAFYPVNFNGEYFVQNKENNNSLLLKNIKGETIKKYSTFTEITNNKDKSFTIVRNMEGLYGVINKNGEYVGELRAKFRKAPIIMQNGFALVEDNKLKIFNKNGNLKKEVTGYESVVSFDKKYLLGIIDINLGSAQILDMDGEEIIKDNFYLQMEGVKFISLYESYSIGDDDVFKNIESLEVLNFDFDKCIESLFIKVTEDGLLNLTSSSNSIEVVTAFENIKRKQLENSPIIDRSLNYSFLFSSETNNDEKQYSDIDNMIISDSDSASAGVFYSYPKDIIHIDPYPYIEEYNSSFKFKHVRLNDMTFYYEAKFRRGDVKKPIIENFTITGYELNDQTTIKYIIAYYTFENKEMDELFYKRLKANLIQQGWLEDSNALMYNSINNSKIQLGLNFLKFFFDPR